MAKRSTLKVFAVLLVLLVLMHLKNWIRWEKQLGKEKIAKGIRMPNIEKELPNVPPRHSLQQNRYWKDKESAALQEINFVLKTLLQVSYRPYEKRTFFNGNFVQSIQKHSSFHHLIILLYILESKHHVPSFRIGMTSSLTNGIGNKQQTLTEIFTYTRPTWMFEQRTL